MGNTLGLHKQENTLNRAKNGEKETQKKQKLQKTSVKKEALRQQRDYPVSEVDAEIDDSSHVTGGDSESCLFHSAENVSVNPDLDSSCRRHYKLGPACSRTSSTFNQHPHVLTSQDFQDGFSLEACIPPEIAQPEAHDISPTARDLLGDGHTETGSDLTSRSKPDMTTRLRVFLPPVTTECKHVALVSAAERTGSPLDYVFPTCTSTPEIEFDQNQTHKVLQAPSSIGCHHPHFYNHHSDKIFQRRGDRRVAQRASPQPQRILSLKITASTCKSTSSGNSSASPTTPTLHRRAANFLALFRSSSKAEDAETSDSENRKTTHNSAVNLGKGHHSSNDEFKVKSKPMWKTWERSRSLKFKQKAKVSIFGTSRKTNKNIGEVAAKDVTGNVGKQEDNDLKVLDDTWKSWLKYNTDNTIETRRHVDSQAIALSDQQDGKVNSCDSQLSHGRSAQQKTAAFTESGQMSREDNLILSQKAAVCILKLEELERSIERTIRDKFPDAESFLLSKRSKEELRGSRSLPTTPSLKKKMYVTRDEAEDLKSRMSDRKGATRFCDETYESSASSARSPVILRRFGARTRHASISPTLARAKTAALFNSPSEMSSLAPSMATRATTKGPACPVHTFDGLLSSAHKSVSKYDNVTDAGSSDTCCTLHDGRLLQDSRDHVLETVSHEDNRTNDEIRPTCSALFGSVSPKLRRHNQYIFNGASHSVDKQKTLPAESGRSHIKSGNDKPCDKDLAASLGDSQGITSVKTPSLIGLVSSKHERLNGRQGIRDQFHAHCLDQDNEGSITETCQEACRVSDFIRNVSTSDHPAFINRSKLRLRADNESYVDNNRDDNTGVEEKPNQHTTGNSDADTCIQEKPNQHTTGKLGTGMHKTPSSDQFSHSARAENVPSTKSPDIYPTAKTDIPGLTDSYGAARKQSTDLAVFGLAAARSFRTFPPSSPVHEKAEKVSSGDTSRTRHSQDARLYPNNGSCNVNQDASVVSQHAPAVSQHAPAVSQHAPAVSQQAPFGSWPTEIKQLCCSPTESSFPETNAASNETSVLLSDGLPLKYDDSKVVRSGPSHSVTIHTRHLGFAFPNNGETISSASLAGCSKPLTGQEKVASELTETNAKSNNKQSLRFVLPKNQPLLQQSEKHCQLSQYNERATVLKHPVSEVISQMISLSQRLPQQHQVHLRQQQGHSLPQTDSVSPDCCTTHTQSVVATVTLPNYEQPFQILEQKVVIVQSNSHRNIGHDVSHSYTPEILTDSGTRASESVHRDISAELLGQSNISNSGRPIFFSRPISGTGLMEDENTTQTSSCGESELREKALVGRTATRMIAGEHKTSDHVPPPSPTTIHQLIEELSEEDEDGANVDDDGKNEKSVTTLNKKEHKMKQFTEIVYKRLSDLLESRSTREVDVDTEVFVAGEALGRDGRKEPELFTELNANKEIDSASRYEILTHMEVAAAAAPSSSASSPFKVLTIESSSSLTTTTSSDSDIEEPSLMFQTFQNANQNAEEDSNEAESTIFKYLKKSSNPSSLDFRDIIRQSCDADKRPGSRVYHSDDDVATGRGLPDYYDDRPLWSRRQKPPGQLSATMMAVQWRERRDRWLKKRRRNKTDLLSTGSSDTGSENCPTRGYSMLRKDSDCFDEENYQTRTACTNEIGSGILTSPKYSKPILPFFDSMQTSCVIGALSQRPFPPKPRQDNRSRPHSHLKLDQCCSRGEGTAHGQTEHNQGARQRHDVPASLDMAIPAIEDTFQELSSVQNILVRMQEWRPTIEDDSQRQCLPLTTENVRSIREYYRDCCLSGCGRRSRLSATDRTESDLDIYSEMPDDASSGSELYADDEGDDEALEPYVTAEDALEASGRVSNRGNVCQRDGNDASDTSVVMSCTFYNSGSQPGKRCDQNEASYSDQTASAQRSTSSAPVPSCHASLNSDEEFWTGSAAAMEESCRQLETAADAVSSTFQNARVQMHDIQYHLQALRRQMEVMQDDLTNISITLTPNTSEQHTGK